METLIKIRKKSLVFRAEAQRLLKLIQKNIKVSNSRAVALDFSKVDFVSRSFVDEFLNAVNLLEAEKIKVTFLHLNPDFQIFINLVRKQKENIKKEIEKVAV